MELIYEKSASLARTFVLTWAEDAKNSEDVWKMAVSKMTSQCDLLFGIRGELHQWIVISKEIQRKDIARRIKNLLKSVKMDQFLIEVETLDRFHAEKWGWLPEFCKPATISAGSSSDPMLQVTPAQEVVWFGKTPKAISVYPPIGLARQLAWLQRRAAACGVELEKDLKYFPDFWLGA